MFGISNVPDTPRNRVAAGIAIALGLAFGFYVAVSGDKDDAPTTPTASASTDLPTVPTPPTSSVDAATGEAMMASGAAMMPDDLTSLDPSDYSIDLARFIPVERGMEQFAAKDEFLVYYNDNAGPQTRVSMTEKMVDGATIFVIRRTGLPDDSVAAEESYALFDAGKLAAYGTRIKCARGSHTTNWTTEICP
jgi:hypothetical protein